MWICDACFDVLRGEHKIHCAVHKASRQEGSYSLLESTHPVSPVTRVVTVRVALEVVHLCGSGVVVGDQFLALCASVVCDSSEVYLEHGQMLC